LCRFIGDEKTTELTLTRKPVRATTVVNGKNTRDGSFWRDSAPSLMTRTAVLMAFLSAIIIAKIISVTAVITYAITSYAVWESNVCNSQNASYIGGCNKDVIVLRVEACPYR
jgi:hypothetical protein